MEKILILDQLQIHRILRIIFLDIKYYQFEEECKFNAVKDIPKLNRQNFIIFDQMSLYQKIGGLIICKII
jgi:hypothetical protein